MKEKDEEMPKPNLSQKQEALSKNSPSPLGPGRRNHSPARVAVYGLLLALAMVLSYVETLIPISLGVPGVKLGLANLVTMVGLYTLGISGTIAVNLLRIVLTGFTFGNMFSMLYSLAGAALSLIFMVLVKRTGWFGSVGVSIVGGVGHNIGQLAVAAFAVQTLGVFSYLPVLLAAGTVAGALIGLLGGMIVQRIGKLIRQ